MKVGRSLLILITLIAFILGLAYIVAGALCIYNWALTLINLGRGVLTNYIPSDPWLGIVLLSIGLTFEASAYYLMRNNVVLNIASLLVGGSVATAVMALQVLAVIASYLDSLITHEELSPNDILMGVLRVDALLGYIAVIPFFMSFMFYRKSIKTTK